MDYKQIVNNFNDFLEKEIRENRIECVMKNKNENINMWQIFKKYYPNIYRNMLNHYFDEVHPY